MMKRLVVETVQRFLRRHCLLSAAGLTYFSLLAIIPILCCVLVVAKLAGVDHLAKREVNRQLDAFIANIERGQDNRLASLTNQSQAELERKRIAAQEFAGQARAISDELFKRVENFNIGTLGWIGFVFLLSTLVSTLGMVEDSFNQIWGLVRSRPFLKRTYSYLLVMLILPILAAVAMSVPILNVVKEVIVATLGATWLTKWVSDGIVMVLDSWAFRFVLTMVFSSVFFSFAYWFMPNCRVGMRNAAIGGILVALAFGGWMKLCAVAQLGIAKSSALYGSFAFVPIVLAWIYMSWQIVLFGACLVKQLENQ